MAITYPNYLGAPDPLFPMNGGDQVRFSQMQCIHFNGSLYTTNCARFIREYTNRDGTNGLPPTHIGATSPYITDNMIFLFYHDNAKEVFTEDEADALGIPLATLEATRAAAVAANLALTNSIHGSETGWRS